MRIDACFDSHVHWAATGEFAQRLRLDDLLCAEQVTTLQPKPHHHHGDWLLGFGWDDAAWPAAPHRSVLDRWRPGEAIVLTKIDGHTRWLSTEALRRAGFLRADFAPPDGAVVARDADGVLTGVIGERANDLVDRILPPPDALSMRRDLLAAMRTFNEAGFTHVRDLTCDARQWDEAVRLDQSGVLTLAVEEFFWVRSPDQLGAIIDLARHARRERTDNLRVRGIKIFLDGTLGSQSALVSRCYHGETHAGLALLSNDELSEALRCAWTAELEVAVHTIGDEAAARVVAVARALNASGLRGRLHLEHAQILRPETVNEMRTLDLKCHLQPAHWLSDHRWLGTRLGDLTALAFPWRRLQEAGIAFHFGSDSPIDPPSVARVAKALELSAEAGVPRLLGGPERYLTHPELGWCSNSFSLFERGAPTQVVFRGEHLI